MVQVIQKALITSALVTVVIAISLVHVASAQQNQEPKSQITNSKYLTIKNLKFRAESFSNSITGTIVNNSTQQVSLVNVYALLYDKDNLLITVESGIADVSTLKPGEDSAFKISLFGLGSETVDHYTILPGGTIGL